MARRGSRPRPPATLALGLATAAHALALAARLVMAAAGRGARRHPGGRPADPPRYTVLAALRGEAARVPPLVAALAALRHPRDRLEVMLLLEADDAETRAAAREAIAAHGSPPWLRAEIVPPGGPRTKPNALQHGLARARGDLLVVYDAEDVPAPDQLARAAAAFAALPPEVVCLQARPVLVARPGDPLGRLMAAEYRFWHGWVIPGLVRLGAPVPLAGTSNHLRTGALRALGGWEPRNLTEDAELGVRIAAAGLRTALLDSVTRETSTPPGPRAWIRQRSRWSQGFLQTWWALVRRRPRARGLPADAAAWAHATLLGTVVLQLTTPVLWVAGLAGARRLGPAGTAGRAALAVVAGGTALRTGTLARAAGQPLGAATLLAPAYWLLEGAAAWRALWALAAHPGRWDRTPHPMPAGPGSPPLRSGRRSPMPA